MEKINKKNFIELTDFSKKDLFAMINKAFDFKSGKIRKLPLKNKIIGLIFEKPSTRTRVSFEVGVQQLGGTSIVLPSGEIHVGTGAEIIEDTAKVLSRYLDGIMMRSNSHETLLNLSRSSMVPVINGLTDFSHPCQIMADLMTIIEQNKLLKDQIVCWLGDCNNVTNSWIQASYIFGFELRISSPKKYWPQKQYIDNFKNKGANIVFTEDPFEAVNNATVVATDVWVSMGDDVGTRNQDFKPYQVNSEKMVKANKNAIFLHCLPALRGKEVTSEVIDGPQSFVFEEAENRLHIQKSILSFLII